MSRATVNAAAMVFSDIAYLRLMPFILSTKSDLGTSFVLFAVLSHRRDRLSKCGVGVKLLVMVTDKTIVLFDGECALCNGLARWIGKRDRHHRMALAPLQRHLPGASGADLSTIVVIHNKRTLTKSDAVIQIARALGGVWKLALVFRIIPRTFRDVIYDWVARHRTKWFGKSESCELPTEFRP